MNFFNQPDFKLSARVGRINQKYALYDLMTKFIQIDGAIHPINSGKPVAVVNLVPNYVWLDIS